MPADTAISLSVVIPTYDEPERLEAALKSLAAQDYPPQWAELIVVDAASPRFDPDGLRAAAEGVAEQRMRACVCQRVLRAQRLHGPPPRGPAARPRASAP